MMTEFLWYFLLLSLSHMKLFQPCSMNFNNQNKNSV